MEFRPHPFTVFSMDSKVSKSVELIVNLLDGSEVIVNCVGGRHTTGGEIKALVLEQIDLPVTAQEAFAIWVVSPSLREFSCLFLFHWVNEI